MAKFDKIAVLKKIGDTGMVPVFYHKDLEVCKHVVKACYEGGVRAFEFTNRGVSVLLLMRLRLPCISGEVPISWWVLCSIPILLPFAIVA